MFLAAEQIWECSKCFFIDKWGVDKSNRLPLHVNGLIKNQRWQTNKNPANQTLHYTLSWYNFPLLMLSLEFSANMKGILLLWKTYYARVTHPLSATYKQCDFSRLLSYQGALIWDKVRIFLFWILFLSIFCPLACTPVHLRAKYLSSSKDHQKNLHYCYTAKVQC